MLRMFEGLKQRQRCLYVDSANHNFIPRNGLVNVEQTVTGLGEAYNMSPDLALFLAVVSVALSGDPLTNRWSIGGAFPSTLPIFPARGIVGTHNKYEGDASIVRVCSRLYVTTLRNSLTCIG